MTLPIPHIVLPTIGLKVTSHDLGVFSFSVKPQQIQ